MHLAYQQSLQQSISITPLHLAVLFAREKGLIIFHYFALLGAEAAIAGKGNIGLLIAGLYGLRYLPMMARSLSGLNKCKYIVRL
jgi:hypothetical protein